MTQPYWELFRLPPGVTAAAYKNEYYTFLPQSGFFKMVEGEPLILLTPALKSLNPQEYQEKFALALLTTGEVAWIYWMP